MAIESIRAVNQAAKRLSEDQTLAGSTIAKSTPRLVASQTWFLKF
jgi:hypothetical protein